VKKVKKTEPIFLKWVGFLNQQQAETCMLTVFAGTNPGMP